MTPLPERKKGEMPEAVTLEKPPFIPRMVMTPQLEAVAREVIHQWKHRKAFEPLAKFGIRPLDRLLFYGPPGNGKTMACYWIARELGIPVYRVLCNNLVDSWVGSSAKNVAAVVDFLEGLRGPAVCLWDEVEAIFVDRKNSHSTAGREICSALTVFMQALDRWAAQTLIVMATNLPDKLDPALLSRVAMRVEFLGPDESQCEQVVQYWSELLHAHGGAEWGPEIAERARAEGVTSFRELQQTIAAAARDWTARHSQ